MSQATPDLLIRALHLNQIPKGSECTSRLRSTAVYCVWGCSVVSDSLTPRTVAHQAPLSMGFSRQECWSGLPFPLPGDLPDPGIELVSPSSPALAGRFFTTEPPGKPSFRSMAFNAATRKAAFHFAFPCFCHCSLLLNTYNIGSSEGRAELKSQ